MKTLNNEQITHPFLPEGANVFYVGIDNEFMAQAKEAARLSNEKQQSTGAVIVFNSEIVASDCNKNPLTNQFLINLHKKYCIRHMLKIPTGKHYWICPGCASKKSHAESRAIKQFLEKGVSGKQADLYLWGHWACCDVCGENIRKIPVKNIFFLKDCEKLFNPKHPHNIIGSQFDNE